MELVHIPYFPVFLEGCQQHKKGCVIFVSRIQKFILSINDKITNVSSFAFESKRSAKLKSQTKFTCTCCGDNACGKPGLKLLCKKCNVDLKQEENDEKRW